MISHTTYRYLMGIGIFLNMGAAPILIRKAKMKMIEITNGSVNDSFSKISIDILRLVRYQEYTTITTLTIFVAVEIYGSVYSRDD